MTVRAYVQHNFLRDGFDLSVVMDEGDGYRVGMVENGQFRWSGLYDRHLTPDEPPLLSASGPVADAIIRAFTEYQARGEGYVRTDARADYLAERARVDKLLNVIAAKVSEKPQVLIAGEGTRLVGGTP